MLYLELRTYLTQITDPDVVDLFDRSAAVFEDLQLENWLDVFDETIGRTSGGGDNEVLDALRNELSVMIDEVLQLHGVVMVHEAMTSDRLNMLQALFAIGNGQEKDTMRLLLQGEDSAQEILADMVQLLTAEPSERILSLLDEVSDSLLNTMRRRQQQTDSLLMDEDISLSQERFAQYAKYRIVFANDTRWCDRFVQNSQAIGLPYDSYARYYGAHQLDVDLLESSDSEIALRRVCVNLIGIGCLSQEGSTQTEMLAKPYLEKVSSDLGVITRVHSKLINLLLEYNRAQT